MLLINFEIFRFCRLILGRFSSCILYYLLRSNELAGFYMRATLALNGLKPHHSHTSCRSSHLEVFFGKRVQKICSIFTGEHLCWSAIMGLYWNCTSAWVFVPVNLLHIFRTPLLKNSSGWLLLKFLSLLNFRTSYWCLSRKAKMYSS